MYTMTKMKRKTATSKIMYDILIMIGPVCLHISPPWMDLQKETYIFKRKIMYFTILFVKGKFYHKMIKTYLRNVNNAATAHIAAPIKATSLPS